MFRVILYTQWKTVRLPLLPAALASFALPILSVRAAGGDPSLVDPVGLLASQATWSIWFPVLAAAVGLLIATMAWMSDHRGGHVYALSLPLPRWKFVLLRFGAGLALLAAPAVAFWVGSLLAAGLASIPIGLQAYPNALALRFAIASLVAFAVFFAISAGTTRTAAYVLAGVSLLVTTHVLLWAGGAEINLLERAMFWLAQGPGPLAVFSGEWMLINV